jgi:hypothetical protein
MNVLRNLKIRVMCRTWELRYLSRYLKVQFRNKALQIFVPLKRGYGYWYANGNPVEGPSVEGKYIQIGRAGFFIGNIAKPAFKLLNIN